MSHDVRNKCPKLLLMAPFIQDMGKHMDLTESHKDMQIRIALERAAHIGDGPNLEGFDSRQYSIWPSFRNLFGVMFRLRKTLTAAQHPVIKALLQRVAEHLPGNPTLVAGERQVRKSSDTLAI